MQDEVIGFIRGRFDDDCHWLDGNCYYFAIILKERFGGEIFYDVVDCHFVCKIGGNFYDHTGITKNNNLTNWNELKNEDELLANRIVRDCIENNNLPF